jgi:hypothetical protein
MIAIDGGTSSAILPTFPTKFKLDYPKERAPKGLNKSERFGWEIERLLALDNVVLESAMIGSSGIEPTILQKVRAESAHELYVVSGRCLKNRAKDLGEQSTVGKNKDHNETSKMLWEIAQEPERAIPAKILEPKYTRLFTTIRPSDARNYQDQKAQEALAVLPTNTHTPKPMMPIGMAIIEWTLAGGTRRETFEKLIGLYEHGYKSFYRRATVDLMQQYAKSETGKTRIEDVSKEERNRAWRASSREIRRLFAERVPMTQAQAEQAALKMGKTQLDIKQWCERLPEGTPAGGW